MHARTERGEERESSLPGYKITDQAVKTLGERQLLEPNFTVALRALMFTPDGQSMWLHWQPC